MWRTRNNIYLHVHYQQYRRRKFNAVFRRGDAACYCIGMLNLDCMRSSAVAHSLRANTNDRKHQCLWLAYFWLLVHPTSVATPLGFIFWTIFRESPFGFHPDIHKTTWFSIGGLALMLPAIFLYNTGPEETEKTTINPQHSPLLQHKQNGINEYT